MSSVSHDDGIVTCAAAEVTGIPDATKRAAHRNAQAGDPAVVPPFG
jgi:hypothetical protein